MIRNATILGAHAFFFRSGAAYTLPNPGGNVDSAHKPGATDPAWYDLGIVDVKVAKTSSEKKIFGASPAKKRLLKILRTKPELTLSIKRAELDNLQLELIWGAAGAAGAAVPDSPNAGGQFTPLAMSASGLQGWLKVQYYADDGADTQITTADVWVDLDVDGDFDPKDDPVETGLKASVLFSTLNTGNLA